MFRGIIHLGGFNRMRRIADAVSKHQSKLLSCNHGPKEPVSQRHMKTDCAVKKDHFNFRILNHVANNQLIEDLSTSGTNVQLDDLELSFSNKRLVFNLTWLRDSCHCTKCTHEYSRQRLFTPKDFKKQIFGVKNVQLSDSDDSYTGVDLKVEWADGHQSKYSLEWLNYINDLFREPQLNIRDKPRARFNFPQDDFYLPSKNNSVEVDHWSVAKIMSNLKPVNYHDLVDSFVFHNEPSHINANKITEMSSKRFNAISTLTQQLLIYGLAKIVDVPLERDHVLLVARSLAYERPTGYGTVFDVVVEPSEEINLAYSSQEFDLHSDLTYREKSPGVQMLHCIRNSVEGGYSYFSDAFNAAIVLRDSHPMLFEVLVQHPVTFVVRDPYRNLKFRKQKSILNLDHQGKLSEVYYSPFMLPPVGFIDDLKLFYLALDHFTKTLQAQENKVIVKMDPGDLFIFHNRRVLHGRSSYNPTTSNRFLQGCYMDWDEIECLHEKMFANDIRKISV